MYFLEEWLLRVGPAHGTVPGQVVLANLRKQAEQAVVSKPARSIPPWLRLQFLPPCSCSAWVHVPTSPSNKALPRRTGWNKPFRPQVALCQQWKPNKTELNNSLHLKTLFSNSWITRILSLIIYSFIKNYPVRTLQMAVTRDQVDVRNKTLSLSIRNLWQVGLREKMKDKPIIFKYLPNSLHRKEQWFCCKRCP